MNMEVGRLDQQEVKEKKKKRKTGRWWITAFFTLLILLFTVVVWRAEKSGGPCSELPIPNVIAVA
jgi:hypothetical protein